jgi:hypothetical protein
MICREFFEHTFQFLIEVVLLIINFILYWGMNIQSNDMTATSYYYVRYPITDKFSLLNNLHDSLMHKKKST